MNIKRLLPFGFAFLAGAILTLAFAPFNAYLCAFLSPALLLWLWRKATPKQAFWRGFIYGLGFFGTGVYWIFISINTYGDTSEFVAVFITGGLMAILALFPAINGYVLNRFFPKNNNAKILFAFPAIWVFLEWVRTWIFSGFPWLLLGYSQISSPLRGYAPILGVYGVSLIVLWVSTLAYKASFYRKGLLKNPYILYFILIFAIGAGLSAITWTHPNDKLVKVSLIQGNIAQEVKWSADQVQPTLDRYVALTQAHWDSQIIIWPESAVPIPQEYAVDFLTSLGQQAAEHQATVITGIPIRAPEHKGFYNSVIALGKGEGVYTKHRLVPFGEYIPMRNVFGKILDFLHVPMSDFIPGVELPKPIMANGVRIAAFICYEIAYPEQVLLRDGNIDMILTISNDAWFGHSIAQAQHLQIAQMRALEMGRPILFVSNDGLTAIINSRGAIQSAAPPHVTYVLTGEVQTEQGKTPWQHLAMYPIDGLVLLLLFIAIRQRQK